MAIRNNFDRHLIFDFDGVLVDSNEIRFSGFQALYMTEADEHLAALMRYVRASPGGSRYEKISYFYTEIKRIAVAQETLDRDAGRYSELVRERVAIASEMPGASTFLNAAASRSLALVSASDEAELLWICQKRGLSSFFQAIKGSPHSKAENIRHVLNLLNWEPRQTTYVGDAMSDYAAAREAGIGFIGFGAQLLGLVEEPVVGSFQELAQLIGITLEPELSIK